jgi:hypothetical protein
LGLPELRELARKAGMPLRLRANDTVTLDLTLTPVR